MNLFTIHHPRRPPLDFWRPGRSLTRLRSWRRRRRFQKAAPYANVLLCRPRGGLNDSLVRIGACLHYAQCFQRQLVIDSNRSGLLDHWDHYFEARLPCANLQLRLSDQLREQLESLHCHPAILNQIGLDYSTSYDEARGRFLEASSGEQLDFDLGQPRSEPLLVYEQWGGGPGLEALTFFRLTPAVRSEVQQRLQRLPAGYLAAHIRHSDATSHYEPFVDALREPLRGCDLLLCTDSLAAREYARRQLPDTRIHSLATLPDTPGQSLHNNPAFTSRATNIDGIADLLAMASARAIILPDTSLSYPSGFAQLAVSLLSNTGLRQQLLQT